MLPGIRRRVVLRRFSAYFPTRVSHDTAFALCECKKREDELPAYNGLVQSWPEITRLACKGRSRTSV